ncbi:NAD(P)-dependent oxidoreductase [Pseudonocardia kujensis]|nr:NAD(P)-dependent oxidoreductase [Pseudonocardia kujensis]
MPNRRIGFIGVGNMGGRMSRCLVAAGRRVLAYDRDPEVARASGGDVAESVAAVTRDSDVVLLSLPDSTVVEAVVLGEDGVLDSCREGQVVVDLSTAAPGSTRRIHGLLAERGVRYVDAGISGGAAAAEKGALTIMAGADPGVLAELEDVFEPIASTVHDMGGPGTGHTAKLLNNFLNAVALASTAEVMVAGKKAGLDLDVLLEVLNTSSGVNFATLNRFPKIVHGDYLEGGLTSALMTKDVTLYVDLVQQLGVASLNAAGPLASFGLANNTGYAQEISNRVVDAIGDVSGGVRVAEPWPAKEN